MTLTANRSEGFAFNPMKSAHLDYVSLFQFGIKGIFALSPTHIGIPKPSTPDAIIHVVFFTAPVKMLRAYTKRIVALVKGALAKLVLTDKESQRKPARLNSPLIVEKHPIPLTVDFSNPQPTSGSISHNKHALHESFFNAHALNIHN